MGRGAAGRGSLPLTLGVLTAARRALPTNPTDPPGSRQTLQVSPRRMKVYEITPSKTAVPVPTRGDMQKSISCKLVLNQVD